MNLIFIPQKALIAIPLILWILISSWGSVESFRSLGLMCVFLAAIGVIISVKNKLKRGLPYVLGGLGGCVIAFFAIFIGRAPNREFHDHPEQYASTAEKARNHSKELQSSNGASRGPVIKGFHIGMSIEKVPVLIESIAPGWASSIRTRVAEYELPYCFPPDFREGRTIILEAGTKFLEVIASGPNLGIPCVVAIFVVDEKEGVSQFFWSEPLVKYFFRAEKMELSDFVQKFVDSYGIPEMKASDDLSYWRHTAPEGWMVKIGDDWSIHVEEVISDEQSDQAFD